MVVAPIGAMGQGRLLYVIQKLLTEEPIFNLPWESFISMKRLNRGFMKVINLKRDKAELIISEEELYAIYNTINEVCNGIDIYEFQTRIGSSRQEMAVLMNELKEVLGHIDQAKRQ